MTALPIWYASQLAFDAGSYDDFGDSQIGGVNVSNDAFTNNGLRFGADRNRPRNHPRRYAFPLYSGARTSAKSIMGYVMLGKGRYQNEILVTYRGSRLGRITDIVRADGRIDLSIALGKSPMGYAVHGGFARVFQGLKPQLDTVFNLISNQYQQGIQAVHCTGHSMGGAIATLTAEYLQGGLKHHSYLYTFGAPRVGLVPHTQYMKKIMGDRINRYYYAGDVVPWLPAWPYVHLPGKRLVSSSTIGGHNDYREAKNLVLAAGERRTADTRQEAEALIRAGGEAGGGYGMGSRAFRYFTLAFHKLLYIVNGTFGFFAVPIITALDQVVTALLYFSRIDKSGNKLVVSWLSGAFKALGKFISSNYVVKNLVSALRHMCSVMMSAIQTQATQDLEEAEAYAARARTGRSPIIRFGQ